MAIEEARFDPARLTVELKRLGVKIALDDFGAGFASIEAMREFGFDRLKIDKSLVLGLDGDKKAPRVLQATVSLATALEIPVTAEGIETETQATVAHLCGCDLLQGYMFSRPITEEEITSRCFSKPERSYRQVNSTKKSNWANTYMLCEAWPTSCRIELRAKWVCANVNPASPTPSDIPEMVTRRLDGGICESRYD
ncbi:EAL domain-containing protein [Pararhizobium sp. PWRC1-1]|uniref:EAL domain-containing protein n=1 Tax=Pararhizobium sp. PWRC1-1 TaxID=2804566 RepID=UPI003CE979BB